MKHNSLSVSGYTSQRRARFVCVTSGDTSVLVPFSAFTLDDKRAKLMLATGGIYTPGSTWRLLCEDVAALLLFPERLIADRPGWSGDAFVMSDGDVIAPSEAGPVAVAFERSSTRCSLKGATEEWIDTIAEPLAGSGSTHDGDHDGVRRAVDRAHRPP